MDNEEIVCFCSNISYLEISEAVTKGAKNIDDVRNVTNKHIVGKCKQLNPTGKCCHTLFQEIIESLLK